MEQYKTVLEGGTGEIIEKKSRFIATVRPMKKRHWLFWRKCANNIGMQDIIVMHTLSEGTENIQDAVMMENRQEPQGVRCLMLFWEKIFIMLRWS